MHVLLNDNWRIARDSDNRGRERRWFASVPEEVRSAPVPGIIQQVFPGYHGVAWYWTQFTPPRLPANSERVLLRFGAVDYLAEVWVNGIAVGGYEGGETPFELDATAAVHAGENLLAVRVVNPGNEPIDGLVLGKIPHRNKVVPPRCGSAFNSGGILYPVELHIVPDLRVCDVFARPDLSTGRIALTVTVRNNHRAAAEAALSVSAAPAAGGAAVAAASAMLACPVGDSVHEIELCVLQPRLWSLDSPFLYRVTVCLDGCEFAIRCGFRDLRVKDGYFHLNGRRLFLKSTHTGNAAPIGQQVAVLSDHVRRDIIFAKASGFNCVRFIAGVAWPEQLDFCDEIGMLVYEECFAAWGLGDSPRMAERFDRNTGDMIRRDRNHPSVAIWGLLNETFDGPVFRHAVDYLPKLRELDPTRLVLLHSGRWDGDSRIGSVSNPGSGQWDAVWGREGCDAARTAFVLDANQNAYGDIHVYPRVPQDAAATRTLRTLGADGKPVFLSEYGIGSLMDVVRDGRHFEQAGARLDLEDAAMIRAQAEALAADWKRLGFDDVYPFVEDMLRESQRLHSRQRTLGFDCVRSNPRLAGYNLTGMLDHAITGEGLWTYWREWKSGTFDAVSDGWSSLRWCLFTDPMHGYSGRKFTVEAVLANEGVLAPGKYPASFRIMGPSGVVWQKKASIQVDGSLATAAIRATVRIDGPAGEYVFAATLDAGGDPTGGRLRFHLSREDELPRPRATARTWGLDAKAVRWLGEHGVRCNALALERAPRRRELILVGRPDTVGRQANLWTRLLERMARGSTIVFFDPRVFQNGDDSTFWLPLATRGRWFTFHDWLYHKECVARRHPVFAGLQAPGVLDMDYYGPVIPHDIFEGLDTPDETIAAAFATGYNHYPTGYGCGLLMGVYRCGDGRIVLSTPPVLDHLSAHPAADRLLLNLVAHVAADPSLRKPLTVEVGRQVRQTHRRWATEALHTPWKHQWRISPPQPLDRPVHKLELNDCKAAEWRHAAPMTWPAVPDFVDIHALDGDRGAMVWATGDIEVPVAMAVELLLGTDGPCRIWIADRVVATQPTAGNPATRDVYAFPVQLPAGRQTITVAFDRRGGLGWGFFLRLRRSGVSGSSARGCLPPVEMPTIDPKPVTALKRKKHPTHETA